MILFRLILLGILFLPCCGLRAQVPARENYKGNSQTRDTTAALKKKISDQYDSLINTCKTQIIVLTFNITNLNKQVDGLKKQIQQEEADYAAWKKNAGRSLSKQQLDFQSQQKHNELLDKIKGIEKQIDILKMSISKQQQQTQKLQSEISLLEKNKAVALSKL